MLTNKNAIITGSSHGIGREILTMFAKNHANVWCLVRRVDPEFQEYINNLQETFQVWIKPVFVDLEDRVSIKKAISTVQADKLPIDILVNNAGINYHGTFLMTPIDEMERLFQVNYYAPIQLIQLTAKRMIRQRSGVIINIGSVSGFEHNTGNFAYSATKATLMWATQTISRELAPYNIRVNGIAPGVTETTINAGNEDVLQSTVIPRMNIKRYGLPEEIAKAVLFMASNESSFISGQVLRVDGGRF